MMEFYSLEVLKKEIKGLTIFIKISTTHTGLVMLFACKIDINNISLENITSALFICYLL